MKPVKGENTCFRTFIGIVVLVVLAGSCGVRFGILKARAAETQSLAAPKVTKVEPPNWWPGHTINPVRLLVRGADLHGAHITATRRETVPHEVVINRAGTYLFISLNIDPLAQPGDYPLLVETTGGRATIPFHLEPVLDARANFQGITTDDVIYLLMPDRFANGDPSNDRPSDAPDAATDRNNRRAWHGGDFRGIIERLPYLKELGVTALWLNPWYDNWNGLNTCDKPWCPTTHYHGYHATDYYAVEDRFGDMATLRELVNKAHAHGLKVIQDQVANHVGIHHPWVSDPPLGTWFHPRRVNRPFRADFLLTPHASIEDRRAMLDSWFTDDLPDLNQEEPEVARYLIQNALWWVGMTGVDGIREDTVQYMPRAFIRELCLALRRQYPKLWIVGEVFNRDPAHTAFFMGGRGGWDGIDTDLDSVFDFPLWQASIDVFTNKKPLRAVRDVLKYDGLYPDASRLTTMLGNHDVPRFLSLDGGSLNGAMLHTAFMLTVRGIPQLYYGDEIALAGTDDPDNRPDFPGGFPEDERRAFEAAGRTAEEEQMYNWTRSWLDLRRRHSALRHGQLIDLAFDEDTYVYARRGAEDIVVVAINRSSLSKSISISATPLEAIEGAQFVPLLDGFRSGQVIEKRLQLQLPPRSAGAYLLRTEGRMDVP